MPSGWSTSAAVLGSLIPCALGSFAPARRLARNLGEDRFIGAEHYENLGRLGMTNSTP